MERRYTEMKSNTRSTSKRDESHTLPLRSAPSRGVPTKNNFSSPSAPTPAEVEARGHPADAAGAFFDGYSAGRSVAMLYPNGTVAYLRGIRHALRDAREREPANHNAALREVGA